jgi:hypothetical protein
MNQHLSRDEFDALAEIGSAQKGAKPSVCVARNGKRLVGIKLLALRKDGTYVLTEKGVEALFVKNCIAGLRALTVNAGAKLDADVATFLGRKGYIVAAAQPGQFEVTARGHECLADIALNP